MSAATLTFEPWCVDYHRAMAATAAVGSAISREASILQLVRDFWSVVRQLRKLLEDLDRISECPPDELRHLIGRLTELHVSLNKVLDMCGKRSLTNRSVINHSIRSIRLRNEHLRDIIEHFELSLAPRVRDGIDRAVAEYEAGETVNIGSLFWSGTAARSLAYDVQVSKQAAKYISKLDAKERKRFQERIKELTGGGSLRSF